MKTLSEEIRWKDTFNAVPDPIMILDANHQILQANKAMADRLGLTPDKFVGKTCYRLVHGVDEPPSFCPHAQLLKDGKRHTVEVREERLGGDFNVSTSPILGINGRLVGSVHVASDITERKRADEELRANEQSLRRTFDQAPLGAAILALDNRYLRVNAELCRITGYSEQELLSTGFPDITHPDDLEKNMKLTRQMLAGEFDHFQMEKRYIRKDGKIIWVRLFARIIK